MSYTHLSKEERFALETLWRAGHSKKDIGRRLGRHTSTVTRELERHGDPYSGWYRASIADKAAHALRAFVNREIHAKLVLGSNLERYVQEKLHLHWSPEQIAGRLGAERAFTKDPTRPTLCAETIYTFIYTHRKDLIPLLRHASKRRYRRRNGTKARERRREEAKKRRIDTRPKEIEQRKELGHWEGDTVFGSDGGRILTHVERKSRYVQGDKLARGTSELVREACTKRFKKMAKQKRRTLTYDNGSEFSEHERIERDTGLAIYFAHPYHSWERGTNENTNGLLREFFPKGSSFKDVTQVHVDAAVKLLNTRPRKCLQFLKPEEVFFERGLTLN